VPPLADVLAFGEKPKPPGKRVEGMMPDPRECLFCHEAIPAYRGESVNLTFLAHLDERNDCRVAFEAWTANMQRDFIGY
jgi:hypothetical protein